MRACCSGSAGHAQAALHGAQPAVNRLAWQITKLYDEYLCQGCQYTNWFEVGVLLQPLPLQQAFNRLPLPLLLLLCCQPCPVGVGLPARLRSVH